LLAAHSKEQEQAIDQVIIELKGLQKQLKGNFLMQVVEKILAIRKTNALNDSSESGLSLILAELMQLIRALMKQLQQQQKKKPAKKRQPVEVAANLTEQ
jgi:hypothetical protein